VQRIFNCDETQDIGLTPYKVLNSLIMDRVSVSSYTRVTNFQKWYSFYGPFCRNSKLHC